MTDAPTSSLRHIRIIDFKQSKFYGRPTTRTFCGEEPTEHDLTVRDALKARRWVTCPTCRHDLDNTVEAA